MQGQVCIRQDAACTSTEVNVKCILFLLSDLYHGCNFFNFSLDPLTGDAKLGLRGDKWGQVVTDGSDGNVHAEHG